MSRRVYSIVVAEGFFHMSFARRIVFGLAAVVLVLARWSVPARSADPPQARILMDWFAQADQAVFWQMQIDSAGQPHPITALQGGPKIQTIPQVAAGQAEFGVGNADDILLARSHGVPVRAIFAFMDYVPYDLVYHPSGSIKKFADLKDKTFAVSLGFGYWEWLKKHYGFTSAREIPVTGDLSLFRLNPDMVQQGYSIFLPYRMDDAGITTAQFKVADLGYRPYAVLFTTDDMVAQHPDEVRAVITATQKAWANFVADPTKVRALVLGMNSQIPPDVHDKAVAQMIQSLVPRRHFGCMTDARWDELTRQLQDVALLPASFDPKPAYVSNMVPGCR
jgi:NitT/TauT family transport system substrate-binding protein